MPEISLIEWNTFLSACPRAHLLQSPAWGELKGSFGWEVVRIVTGRNGNLAGAQVFFRRFPLGYSIAYIPKGPVHMEATDLVSLSNLYAWQPLLADIDRACRKRRAILLKLEPDLESACPDDTLAEPPPGFRCSSHSIQPPSTILVDLAGDESEILGRMKQKTRYNIRLAEKKGVRVLPSTDIAAFHRLLQITSRRDRFFVHSLAYYQRAFELFSEHEQCRLLLATHQGQVLGGLMVFAQGPRAWYLYGASADEGRALMPAYLLQWEAMRWARQIGCTEYDLWGIPDVEPEQLEAEFTQRSDGLWGVYRFKRGFGGELRRSAAPLERVYRPGLHRLYRLLARRGGDV